jgi:hypothetical protein
MMKTRILSLLVVTAFLSLIASAAAPPPRVIPMDLAVQEEGETSIESVEPGESFIVQIVNRMPNQRYTIKVERRREVLEPLPQLNRPAAAPAVDPCDDVVSNFDTDIFTAVDEQNVAEKIGDARIAAAGCGAAVIAKLETVIDVRTVVRKKYGPFSLSRGESIVITVSRGGGTDKKTWILEITTGRSGEWRVLYGFNYVPDDDDHFFLKENPGTAATGTTPATPTTYSITEERGDNDFSFVPTIFASWQANRPGPLSWGLSGGMGFESAKPIIFVGPSVIFRQNISLNLGLVMKERRRLDPQLDRTKPLTDLIANDKLYRTDGYRPSWFIGIGFRFDTNPFKGGEAPADEKDK